MNYKLYHAEDFAADESFISYYLGTDEASIVFWQEWISLNPEKLDEVYRAERLIQMLSLTLPGSELSKAFDKFDAFLGAEEAATLGFEPKRGKLNWNVMAYAAVVILMLATGVFYFSANRQVPVSKYTSSFNPHGVRSTIILSDGTKVYLNSYSKLEYPKVFAGHTRDVFLEGEAFFEVTKDRTKPFTVTSAGVKTRVLGTRFNISAYKNVKDIRVALVEGSVEVSAIGSNEKMLIKPKEMAIFDPDDSHFQRLAFNNEDVTGWKEGRIIFNQASFEDVSIKLRNAYGIQLRDQTGLKWSFSGQFENVSYLSIIKSLCFAKGMTFTEKNHTIILTK